MEKINKLIEKIKTGDSKCIDQLMDITKFYYSKTTEEFNGKLNKPILCFDNIRVTKDHKHDAIRNENVLEYQKQMTKMNNIRFHYFINTGHFPWEISEYSSEMIRQIKCFI